MVTLVITAHDDPTAALVCDALDERETPYCRIDLGDFPGKLQVIARRTVDGWRGHLATPSIVVPLEQVSAVYYRRPTGFAMEESMCAEHRRFGVAEARQGPGGLLASLPALFVNHPARTADAELKPVQLQIASQVGLDVPATLITSDGAAARAFAASVGDLVYKPLSSPLLRRPESAEMIFTSPVKPSDLADDVAVGATATLFQRYVDKRFDVRVTVVGKLCFAAAIEARTAGAVRDWRTDYDALSYRIVEVPAEVRAAIGRYLGRLDLRFGCFDFSVDRSGRWWFLECNANGQWGWIAAETGLPIASAMADLLSGSTT